jgi:hypothetical protein
MEVAMNPVSRSSRVLMLCVLAGLAGCASDDASSSTTSREPVTSSATAHGSSRLGQQGEAAARADLEFFDALETRSAVSRDDVIHAALLTGAGSSGSTPAQRLDLAKQLGWTDPAWKQGSSMALATVGDAAQVFGAVLSDARSGSTGARVSLGTPDASAQRLAASGMLPKTLKPASPITGGQLVALAGKTSDALGPQLVAAIDPQSGIARLTVGPTAPGVGEGVSRSSGDESFDAFTPGADASATGATPPAPAEGFKESRVIASAEESFDEFSTGAA